MGRQARTGSDEPMSLTFHQRKALEAAGDEAVYARLQTAHAAPSWVIAFPGAHVTRHDAETWLAQRQAARLRRLPRRPFGLAIGRILRRWVAMAAKGRPCWTPGCEPPGASVPFDRLCRWRARRPDLARVTALASQVTGSAFWTTQNRAPLGSSSTTKSAPASYLQGYRRAPSATRRSTSTSCCGV